MGNEGHSKVVGIGDISLETNLGYKLVLKNVRHVPDFRLSLFSVCKLDEDGFDIHLGRDRWKMSKGSLVVAKGEETISLYVMEVKIYDGFVNVVDDSMCNLWHKRLCHMGAKGMDILAKQKSIPDMQDVCGPMIVIEKINTDDNGSDMITKSLPNEKHETCVSIAGMADSSL